MRQMGLAWGVTALLAAIPAAAADQRLAVAVMDLSARGVDPDAAAALGTQVSNSLAALRVFRVITREDIKRLLQLEQTRQQCTGESDAACLAEIGGALGVDHLVYGEVAKVAGTYALSLVLLDIGRAEAVSRETARTDDAGALLSATEQATRRLVQPLLSDRTGFLLVEARELGAEVRVDGRLIGVTPLPSRLELPMGPHELKVDKEGFLSWARTVDLEAGQPTVAPVALVPSEAFVADYQHRAQTVRGAAWASVAASTLLFGAGAALALIADARFDDLAGQGWISRDPGACAAATAGGRWCHTPLGLQSGSLDEASAIETFDTLAVTAAVTGGVAAIAALVLFLAGDDPARYDAFGAPAVGGASMRF